jgi:hypothetical protein
LASRTKTPPPANRTERRSHGTKRKTPLGLIAAPIVLVVAAAILVLILTGKGGTLIDTITPGGDEPVPAFDFKPFKPAHVRVVSTTEGADEQALRSAATTAATAAVPVLDNLFTEAFLDPNNWKDGSYDEAFVDFTDDAAAQATGAGLETVTLGADAGATYQTVSPSKGSIRFDVLFDRDGNAFSVAAHVKFYALGERKDGTYTAIVSHGVVFLRDTGGWSVIGYDLKRNDHETEPPTPSPSAGASASTGGSS